MKTNHWNRRFRFAIAVMAGFSRAVGRLFEREKGDRRRLASEAGARDASLEPRYMVRTESTTLRRFTAQADQPRVSQALLDATRTMPGSLGLVVVEVHDRPREWTSATLDRSVVLETLVGIRDLLGKGGLDVAVFSPDQGAEIFLDRFATLEIRCGAWDEPRFRGMLEQLGFARSEWVSSLPDSYRDPEAWPEENRRRVEELCASVGLETPPGNSETAGAS